ncbi:penicillin-binding protein 2 [Candidatus Dojkabacteria bacterium]|nr:penicillin-binding protein 2 [Candidatus Dojkabacteria bacterium]
MSKIEFDKKLNSKTLHKPIIKKGSNKIVSRKKIISKAIIEGEKGLNISGWNFIYAFLLFFTIFGVLIFNIAKLQIIEGEEMLERSIKNKVRVTSIDAYRGVIFDSNGQKLVENIPSSDIYISFEKFYKEGEGLDNNEISKVLNTLGGIIGENWKNKEEDGTVYTSLSERVFTIYNDNPYLNKILLAKDVNNEILIKIKSMSEELKGISIVDGSKRNYVYKDIYSHILGYTGEVSEKDLEKFDFLFSGDTIGKSGIERYYEEKLHGIDGQVAQEVDAFGRSISENPYTLKDPVSGYSLYLTVNTDVQNQFFELIKEAVNKISAAGGAGVIQDVNTGEILAIVSYPSYDNNLFVNGISQSDYTSLISDKRNPLLDRSIAAQIPPGSTFKTIVAAAGLEDGVINKNSTYVSRSGYTFSNGAPFQEFRNHAYGTLNVTSALMVSSNIFFCEMIRDWSMSELVPYLESFGIGEYTGIDIPGEMPGRLPSPENKIKLAQTTSPWLEPIWYPEGDSCNSVIGQGITLVTPIQMSNWIAAIANGGTLNTPHVGKKFVDENGFEYDISYSPLHQNFVSTSTLDTVKRGMWEAVNGSRGIAKTLSTTGTIVAAKTGTAEFGKVNSKGIYEDTHAWVTGFFPYENPKYSFSLLLEDGGTSTNATAVMSKMISWMVSSGFVK